MESQLTEAVPGALDPADVQRKSNQLQTLTARLPEEAVQALANEVVARLSVNLQANEQITRRIAPEEIEELSNALVSPDTDAAQVMVSRIRADGTSVADVYLLYLAAAARRLGEKWETDELSFVDVTLGTSRILGIMRSLREAFRKRRNTEGRELIFAAVPNEEHIIGVTMAADLFRQEGWEVELLLTSTHEEIINRVGQSDASVVGLTAHGTRSLAGLVKLIAAIHIVNPTINVIVSGNIVENTKSIIALTGADGFANDIQTALVEVMRLCDSIDASSQTE